MRGGAPIYVESRIRASLDDLWEATQDPALHQRWDLRFGTITYLPRDPEAAQQFTYSTTVLPWLTISGIGESLGDKDRPDGSRWSGLRFWAPDPRSIIESGGGYWRYIPTEDGVRFLTRYDYTTRWGIAGRLVDRIIFRPVFGWATAWSFDRLRLWLEEGVPPERSRDLAVANAAALAGVAGVWLYQGIVPKLWKADSGEVDIWTRLGLPELFAKRAVRLVGIVETALGVASVLEGRQRRWPHLVTLGLMPIALVGVATVDPRRLSQAFNPTTLNWSLSALAAIALATQKGTPSAARALRIMPDSQPEVKLAQ